MGMMSCTESVSHLRHDSHHMRHRALSGETKWQVITNGYFESEVAGPPDCVIAGPACNYQLRIFRVRMNVIAATATSTSWPPVAPHLLREV